MKIGLENKKQVYALSILGGVAAILVYTQLLSGPSSTPAPAPRSSEATDAAAAVAERPPAADTAKPVTPARTRPATNDFHPKVRPKKKEEQIADITKVDPKIRFDYMQAAMKVPPAGGKRDLFQISKTPPVIADASKPIIEPHVFRPYGPMAPPPPVQPKPAGPPPPPPPPPPIPLKYYAVSTLHPDGTRTAYVSDGDEIYEAKEGTLIKGRYRVVQISIEKILVEDTVEKRRQAVNMEPETMG